jgi:hypothetical protein
MGIQTSFHSPFGGTDFLGMRRSRSGETEIVYDNGASQRMIWRVTGLHLNEDRLTDALQAAVSARRVLPTLFDELTKRAIAIESVQA